MKNTTSAVEMPTITTIPIPESLESLAMFSSMTMVDGVGSDRVATEVKVIVVGGDCTISFLPNVVGYMVAVERVLVTAVIVEAVVEVHKLGKVRRPSIST